jgi:hypothetical protein
MRTIGKLGLWTVSGAALGLVLGIASAGCGGGGCGESCFTGGSAGQAGTSGTAGQGGSAGTGAQGGTAGAGGSGPDHCGNDPTKADSVANDCGVFVAPDALAGGTGTKEQPFSTFTEAALALKLDKNPKRIFACTGTVQEQDTVTLVGGVQVIGGFEACSGGATNWTWAGKDPTKNTRLRGVANKPALIFDGGDNGLDHVDVEAPSADVPGASSIAVIVDSAAGAASIDIKSATLTAGDAAAGAPGIDLGGNPDINGLDGKPGVAACDVGAVHAGGTAVTGPACLGGEMSISGIGGVGNAAGQDGGQGGDGTPGNPPAGAGGKGEDNTACANGADGAKGADGVHGAGAAADGTISAAGFAGVAGADGVKGAVGQGGGGGGAARGANLVLCPGGALNVPGASGGSGGTGGCGGEGTTGGQGGGSSIGLIVLNATATFENATMSIGKGGAGGKGGNGQPGGNSGAGAAGGAGNGSAKKGCAGGSGGAGGNGGSGGGGRGGHAFGVAYLGMGAPPDPKGATILLPAAMSAPGGMGGLMNDPGKGMDGLVEDVHIFQ